MVESQARHVMNTEPGRVPGIGRCVHFVIAQIHERVVGYGDHPLPRIAIDRTKGVKLLQEYIAQAGFFG